MSEPKSKLEIILMPLVIALVGIVGTITIKTYEVENAKKLAQAQIFNADRLAQAQAEVAKKKADADRQIKVLEIFSAKITGSDKDREIALRFLRELDPDLHEKLASAVAESEPKDSLIGSLALNEVAIADQRLFDEKQSKKVEKGATLSEELVRQKIIEDADVQNKSLSKTKTTIVDTPAICEKYNNYTSEKWEKEFLKGFEVGKWDVYVASLRRGGDLDEAKNTVTAYNSRFPNHKFKYLATYSSSNNENYRYAVLIAQGLDDEATARDIASFADKCGIAKGAYAFRQ